MHLAILEHASYIPIPGQEHSGEKPIISLHKLKWRSGEEHSGEKSIIPLHKRSGSTYTSSDLTHLAQSVTLVTTVI